MSAILVPTIASLAIFAVLTLESAIFAEVTALSAISVVPILLDAMCLVNTESSGKTLVMITFLDTPPSLISNSSLPSVLVSAVSADILICAIYYSAIM